MSPRGEGVKGDEGGQWGQQGKWGSMRVNGVDGGQWGQYGSTGVYASKLGSMGVFGGLQLLRPSTFLPVKRLDGKVGTLPPDAKSAFLQLQNALVSDAVDAATGGQETKGGFGAILCQENNEGKMCSIAHASRFLKDHEKNYNPYLAEMNAAAWAIEHFDIYLLGRKFVLYTDHKPLETLNSVHQKTLNRLQEKMSLYDFELRYKKGSEMPADVLSRMPVTNICHVQSVPNNQFTAISQHMASDPFCIAVSKFLDTNIVDPNFSKHIHKFSNFFQRSNGLLKISLPYKELLILPNSLANTVMDHAHGSICLPVMVV